MNFIKLTLLDDNLIAVNLDNVFYIEQYVKKEENSNTFITAICDINGELTFVKENIDEIYSIIEMMQKTNRRAYSMR